MQTATATVAGRRRVSFTLPEPAATTFIPKDVESEGRRSTWPPTRTERYPEGPRKARAPCAAGRATGAGRGRSARGGGRGLSLIATRRSWSRSRCAPGGSRRRPSFFAVQRQQFFGLVTLFKRAVSARRRDARYGGGVYACLPRAGRGRRVAWSPRCNKIVARTSGW